MRPSFPEASRVVPGGATRRQADADPLGTVGIVTPRRGSQPFLPPPTPIKQPQRRLAGAKEAGEHRDGHASVRRLRAVSFFRRGEAVGERIGATLSMAPAAPAAKLAASMTLAAKRAQQWLWRHQWLWPTGGIVWRNQWFWRQKGLWRHCHNGPGGNNGSRGKAGGSNGLAAWRQCGGVDNLDRRGALGPLPRRLPSRRAGWTDGCLPVGMRGAAGIRSACCQHQAPPPQDSRENVATAFGSGASEQP
eukprot:gene1001-biopygen10318